MGIKMEEINILIIDDEVLIREVIKDFLYEKSFQIYESDCATKAFKILDSEEIDIVLLDLMLPDINGLDILKKIKKQYPSIEVIMITGHGDFDNIREAIQFGAFDFFNKPLRLDEIQASIERTKKYVNLNKKFKQIKDDFSLISEELSNNIGDIIGKSIAIKKVLDLTFKAAQSLDTSVLITGPTGSGKELIAKVIHYASLRKKSIFYPLNCSAIPETLIESELFGHIKGSFTGALENRKGAFEAAHNGSLFLDEIGDMPLNLQVKLLRVLEDKKFKKIGTNNDIIVNTRVISATNKNINDMISKNQFRKDLYYRLNTLEIIIPPLKNRKEDIPLLVEHYVKFYSKKLNKKITKIKDIVFDILTNYDFPGNVRELRNMIERAIILCNGTELSIENFPLAKQETIIENKIDINENLNLIEMEIKLIKLALKKTNFNKTKASELLGISWFALDRKMKKHNIVTN